MSMEVYVDAYDDEGLLKPDMLVGMDLEDIQNLIDLINQINIKDQKNLELLRAERMKKFTQMCEQKGVTSFEYGEHTYTKQPKTKISGALVAVKQPLLWKDMTMNHQDMFMPSTKTFDDYLKSQDVKPAKRKEIIKSVSIDMEPSVKVTKH